MRSPETIFGRTYNPLSLPLLQINLPGDVVAWNLMQNAAVWFSGSGNPGTQNGQLNGNLYYDILTGNVWQLQSSVWVQVASGGGGGGTPGGSNTQIQFNNNGVFGGAASATYNSGTGVITLAKSLTFSGSTSGSASVGVAAVAGTPNPIQLPIATGASGGVLVTNGANPQQLSWSTNIPTLTGNNTFTGTDNFTGTLGIAGNLNIPGSALYVFPSASFSPMTLTVVPSISGSTTWSYQVMAFIGNMAVSTSPVATTTSGSATLDGTHYNTITWSAVPQATSYVLYRTAAGGTPNTIGFIQSYPNSFLTDQDQGYSLKGDANVGPWVNIPTPTTIFDPEYGFVGISEKAGLHIGSSYNSFTVGSGQPETYVETRAGYYTGLLNVFVGTKGTFSTYPVYAARILMESSGTSYPPFIIGLDLAADSIAGSDATGLHVAAASDHNNGPITNITGIRALGLARSQFAPASVTNLYAGKFSAQNSSLGVVTNSYGIYITSGTNSGGGSVTNNYGLYLEDQTVGGTNYSIYSVGGPSYHAGEFSFGVPFSSLYAPWVAVALEDGGQINAYQINPPEFAGAVQGSAQSNRTGTSGSSQVAGVQGSAIVYGSGTQSPWGVSGAAYNFSSTTTLYTIGVLSYAACFAPNSNLIIGTHAAIEADPITFTGNIALAAAIYSPPFNIDVTHGGAGPFPTGTITALYGIYQDAPARCANGLATFSAAYYSADTTGSAGAGNWSFYSAGGKNFFGGPITTGGVLTFNGSVSGSAAINVASSAGTPNPLLLPTSTGTAGYVLQTNGGSPQQLSWVPQTSGGTVTSFSAGNFSPLFTTGVATAGTTPALTFAAVTQSPNLVFAGPTSGGAVAPTFRALVSADMPAGIGVPGGSNTQFQYNNSGAFGGIADLTFTSPHTIAGGASGIFDFSAVSSFKLPITATDVIFAGSGGAVTGSSKFTWDNSGNILSSGYGIKLSGSTSGSASIAAAASAGTPNTLVLPTSTGTNGYVLQTDGGSPQQLSWVPQSGSAGSGTVTSFSADATFSPLFTTSVATAATTPALSFAQITQSSNLIFAGPTTGSPANPTFRAMVSADLPAGVGVPGGSNTQFQYNNSGAFGGIADLTFTSPHTITGGVSGIFDFSAVSSFKLPVTAGDVVYAGTSGAAAGSSNFTWNNSTNVLTSGFSLTLIGSTSGSASIGAAATAGTPNKLVLPTSTGTSGYVLSTDGGSPQQLSWIPAGAGTVTSFSSGSLSPLFTTSVATAGTTPALSFAQVNQNANLVYSGPTSGGAAGPTFRALVSADIPNLSAAKITSGILSLPQGGTGVDLSATGGTTMVLAQNASHVISARNLVAADIPNLSGAIITSGKVGLSVGGTNSDLSATGGASQVLKQTSVGGVITVAQLALTDITGTIAIGQTALTTFGDIMYANAVPALTRLAGNITTAKQFLSQTGSGAASAAPVWSAISASDISSGTLAVGRGGAGADLSLTGGTSQVLRQSSVGAAITVSQLNYTDITGTVPIPVSGTVADGSPISFVGSSHPGPVTITLNHTTGTRAFNVSGLTDGAVYTVIFIQDSTGGAQVTLGTGTTWKIGGNGGGAITLNTTANNQDRFVFQVIGGVSYGTLQTQFN